MVADASLIAHFSQLCDPRINRRKQHLLLDIVVIGVLAVICGADAWTEMELFGKAKRKWLKAFLALPNGIPSHDTFARVFARIDPRQFEACFRSWTQDLAAAQLTPPTAASQAGEVVAIDGKALRGSFDTFLGQNPIQMVSAWVSANRVVLGQVKVNEKSNEIRAIPELLQLLELSGSIVTIDAIGCQKEIAKTIIDQGCDYVLAVKANQPHLHEELRELFRCAEEDGYREVEHDVCKMTTKGHGRIEIRRCWTISDPDYLAYIRDRAGWTKLSALVRFEYERHERDKVTRHRRYYITSLAGKARQLLAAVRNHWSIENSLHWVLDIAFREDQSRIRKDHGPENFALLRRMAINLAKQDHTIKVGVKSKRLKAGWDEDYLLHLLFGHN
jgi:predicted transposase YbfD/YdcC